MLDGGQKRRERHELHLLEVRFTEETDAFCKTRVGPRFSDARAVDENMVTAFPASVAVPYLLLGRVWCERAGLFALRHVPH